MINKFELSKSQTEFIENWGEEVKKTHGTYGQFEFTFTCCGMGNNLKVKNTLTKEVKDLSDYEKW